MVPAADAGADALPLALSLGGTAPLLPVADPYSVARLQLERVLPTVLEDARRAAALARRLPPVGGPRPAPVALAASSARASSSATRTWWRGPTAGGPSSWSPAWLTPECRWRRSWPRCWRRPEREVGRRWELRQWNVAQEHAATAIADAALAVITVDAGPGDHGHVVVGCVEGEWHTMAPRMVAEVLRAGMVGDGPRPLGAGADLVDYATAAAADAVAVSCSTPTELTGAGRAIAACRREGVPVVAGGAGFGRGVTPGPWGRTRGRPIRSPPRSASRAGRPPRPPDPPPVSVPDDEQLHLEAASPDLVAGALRRLEIEARGRGGDAGPLHEGVEMAVAAIESAGLVGEAEALAACLPMIGRSPRAAALVDAARALSPGGWPPP